MNEREPEGAAENGEAEVPPKDPSQTPSAVIRLVDPTGVQWTYGSIHDVPLEQRPLLGESVVDLNMFETPPNRDMWQTAPETMTAVEIDEPTGISPMWWIVGALALSVIGIIAAVWILAN
ncbi:MAG: hypothetical protein ACOYN0_07650 [Phycisphaerales bacterium]